MNRNLKIYLIKMGFILFPVLILVLLLCPVCSITLDSKGNGLDLGYIETESVSVTETVNFSGIDIMRAMALKENYDGNSPTMKRLASIKELMGIGTSGSENILAVAVFAFLCLVLAIILIVVIDFGFSGFACGKGGRFLGWVQIVELVLGSILAVFCTLFVIFAPRLASFSASNNLILINISSAVLPCAIAMCVAAWCYVLVRSGLMITKMFYSQKLVCQNGI